MVTEEKLISTKAVWDFFYGEKRGNPTPEEFASFLTEVEPQQEEAVDVTEIKMTPIVEGLPVRDELRGEQTILTYNDKVGTWDISFMEAGWDDYGSGFALGVTHWLDITSMWPGVIAQVASFYPTPVQKVQESQTVSEATVILGAQRIFEIFCGSKVDWQAHALDDAEDTIFRSADWQQAMAYSRAALEPSPALHSIRED